MQRVIWAAAFMAAVAVAGTADAQVGVFWDGGDGLWNDANWTSGDVSGQLATDVFNGKDSGSDGGHNIYINSGTVTYDQNTHGDFTLRQDNGPVTLTIGQGAKLTMDESTCCEDGQWARWDPSNVILDGGTYERTLTTGMGSLSGGMNAMGSWNADPGQTVRTTLKNGGQIIIDGIWLQGYGDSLSENVTLKTVIFDGHMNLTGGENYPMGDLLWATDLVLSYAHPDATTDDFVTPLNLKNSIEFRRTSAGAIGSLTVSDGGIAAPYKDEFNTWNDVTTLRTYQELWDRDVITAYGMSARSGRNFDNFFVATGSSGSDGYKLELKSVEEVTWDGGDGDWNDLNWNGSQDISVITGRSNGSRGGFEVIVGSGATVSYDPNWDTGNDDNLDFRMDNGYSKFTIRDGATVTFNSRKSDPADPFEDGYWTTIDADMDIDGGTLIRTFSGTEQQAGGMLLFGSWNADDGLQTDIRVINGGRIENDGIVLFGYEDEMGPDVSVTMTINTGGELDLTGGDNFPMGDLSWANDLVMTTLDPVALNDNGEVANFSAAINFTGSGSITVDEGGIANPHKDEFDTWQDVTTLITYEDLWARGLLQANGLSGLDGEIFADYFTTENSSGDPDYKLISLIPDIGGIGADFDNNGIVDGDDFLIWQTGFGSPGDHSMGDADNNGVVDGDDFLIWQQQFGGPPSGGASAAVPEPASAVLACLAALLLASLRRRRIA